MEGTALTSILPNLSVGVVAIGAIVYITMLNNKRAREDQTEFLTELKEREKAFRELESEIRTNIFEQLQENSRVMERVIDHINSVHK